MRLPDFMDPTRARSAAFGLAVLTISGAALGALWLAADHAPHRPAVHVGSTPDCRTDGDRTCGSNVTWQEPGTYPAPDGGTYLVYEVSPYSACLAAANIPGPSGFAGEVCEPLAPTLTP